MLFTDLLPCPFCGNAFPFTYISFDCAVLRCECGAEMENGAVTVMYKRDKLPNELEPYAYEADALVIKSGDKIIGYPEHGYVGVSAMAAFAYVGLTEKWNKRTIVGG